MPEISCKGIWGSFRPAAFQRDGANPSGWSASEAADHQEKVEHNARAYGTSATLLRRQADLYRRAKTAPARAKPAKDTESETSWNVGEEPAILT